MDNLEINLNDLPFINDANIDVDTEIDIDKMLEGLEKILMRGCY